jgi:hypothetical protein
MEELEDWRPYIRALIYPVQFEPEPVRGIDRVLKFVVRSGALDASPAVYLAAVRAALASNDRLAELIPQDHSETAIRELLTELERRLAVMPIDL